ncbi:ragulator complex protein LAMTOR5-like [Anthonomus grandis grandis]|uniref:ragulator complex protein LAMTOR5-like n=1 Tax=Anthonomus grandis grandis TaxID=2921223 RepID=UPI0021663877|nr:ragulator complex protein LAMTOR5-like [Anthonomus grandis grandis]
MEKNLDQVMDEICSSPDVIGCIFADQQGLCLGAKGKVTNETAGFITAMANQASKLEPNNQMPIIVLENDTQLCMIRKTGPSGTSTGAIYKKKLA